MGAPPEIPIPGRIIALMQERNRLFAFPAEQLAREIRKTGFRCSRCGSCCTSPVNNHIFLRDRDVNDLRTIDFAALCNRIPVRAPVFSGLG